MPAKAGGGIQAQLMNLFHLQDYKATLLLFKYCPSVLGRGNGNKPKMDIKTFEDLKGYYKCIKPWMTQDFVDTLYITDEGFKNGEKWLINKLHQKKVVELYLSLYEKGIGGDTKSIKEFESLSSKFLKEEIETEDEQFLNGIKLPDEDDSD